MEFGLGNWAVLDAIVVVTYFALVLAIGVWAGRGERDATDYFLAGRALPWYLIGFSLFASNMSGASFVGLIGASYSYGLAVFHYEWTAALVLIVFAVFILPVFLRAKLFTVPEYLEARFDRRARYAYSGFTILTLLFIDMAGALFAGGIVIGTLFPEIGLWPASAFLALLAGLYTLIGGLRAVVITDALQAVLILFGSALILVVGLDAAGGWQAVVSRLEPQQTELFRSVDDGFLPWPGIVGVLLLGFYYWTLNQYFVQRALAAGSLSEGRKGALFGGLLKLPNVFFMVMPGMIALALYPDLESPDQAFPVLAFELLPIGLRGLVLTALIAAIMSSLDSAMNAAASLLTMDFVRSQRPETSGRQLLLIGRIFTGLLMIIAALYAPVIAEFGSLFAYFQSTLAYLVPPIVAVYFGGLFVKRLPPGAGFPALIGGLGLGAALYLCKEVTGVWAGFGLPHIHFTYMAMALFAATAALLAVFSVTSAPAPAPAEAVFRRSDLTEGITGRSWMADYRLQASVLFVLMIAVVAAFW